MCKFAQLYACHELFLNQRKKQTNINLSVSWWRLFQERRVRTKFDIYVFIHPDLLKYCINFVINKMCLFGSLSKLSPLSLYKNTLFTEKSIRRFITVGIIILDIYCIGETFGNYTRWYLCHINLVNWNIITFKLRFGYIKLAEHRHCFEWSCIYVLVISTLPLSIGLLLNFRTGPKVWYALLFIYCLTFFFNLLFSATDRGLDRMVVVAISNYLISA
jgi:hypothetical protein